MRHVIILLTLILITACGHRDYTDSEWGALSRGVGEVQRR